MSPRLDQNRPSDFRPSSSGAGDESARSSTFVCSMPRPRRDTTIWRRLRELIALAQEVPLDFSLLPDAVRNICAFVRRDGGFRSVHEQPQTTQ